MYLEAPKRKEGGGDFHPPLRSSLFSLMTRANVSFSPNPTYTLKKTLEEHELVFVGQEEEVMSWREVEELNSNVLSWRIEDSISIEQKYNIVRV